MVALLVFIMAILAEKKKEKKRNCWMQKFSKIRVAIYFLYKSIITVIDTTFKFIVIDTHICFALKKHAALGECGY